MKETKKILIAGGSGFIGRYVSNYLSAKGYTVSLLSRNINKQSKYSQYLWAPLQGKIDAKALHEKDVIINLSGAGIADKLWTRKRKEIIYRSRIDSTALLVNTLINNTYSPSLFINASAIGYYGSRPKELLTEDSEPGGGFVAKLCTDWENQLTSLRNIGIPTAILRIGIVYGKDGGSLSRLLMPLRLGMNVLFDEGTHIISWIHIYDLALVVEKLILGDLRPEIYNAVSQNAVSQQAFNSEALNLLGKKALKIRISKNVLHFIAGELTSVLTADQNIQAQNLLDQKFSFNFPDIKSALNDLL